jgi:HPt (histidine-containing phosphotransfer) domain-containing protein
MSDVEIPEEARIKYIERRKVDLENCKKALQQQDFDTLARVGHQVKGNAATFGYDQLSTIAIDLEAFALKKDTKGLDSVLARFTKFLSQP